MSTHRARFIRVGAGIAVGVIGVALAYAVNRALTDVPFQHLLRDPSHVTGTSPWIGALSFLGWSGWVAAAVLLLTGGWLRRRVHSRDRRGQFLMVTGSLTFGVVLDDALQLHERVLPDATGIGEDAWYLLYGFVLVVWAGLYRGELRAAPVELAVAAVLLGLSQLLDVVDVARDIAGAGVPRAVIWEEGLKLIGIGFFVAFAVIELGRAVVRCEPARGHGPG